MTTPRSKQIDSERPGYYHITARNVRRSWLCGVDEYTGVNYDHRKIWVREKIKELNESFFIDVVAYAVMNNHLHLVLKNRPDLVRIATDLELATRYLTVYPGSRHEKDVPRIATDEEIEELSLDKKRMKFVREKMSSISSFMQRLKEFISVKANKEDKCKGHFWEYRFGSQLLTDEKALLLCSVYVDLNPIRAKVCELPEESEFTSVCDRIKSRVSKEKVDAIQQIEKTKGEITEAQKNLLLLEADQTEKSSWLGNFSPIKNRKNDNRQYFYHITETDYLELIDWTGRVFHRKSKGIIPANVEGILNRLNFKEDIWLDAITNYGSLFTMFAGSLKGLKGRVLSTNKKWLKGTANNKQIFEST